MQDALVKRYSSLSFDCQISTCTGLLEDGQGVLEQNEPDASMEYLEGIANMRYALMVVAELLHKQPNTPIMVQTVAKMTTPPSKNMTDKEIFEERKLSDSAEDKEEEGSSEIEPVVSTEPIEETEHIEVEIVDTQPTDISADKKQEQTAHPQEIGESVDRSEENILKIKVSTEDMDTGYTEVEEAHQPLITVPSIDSDAGSEADPATQLLLAARSACGTSLTAGPSHYLLKLIVRQFGFSFLRKLVKVHPWVIPQGLTWTGEVHTCSCM